MSNPSHEQSPSHTTTNPFPITHHHPRPTVSARTARTKSKDDVSNEMDDSPRASRAALLEPMPLQRMQRPSNATSHADGKQAALSPSAHNRCSPGWMWFNNKCWVSTQTRKPFANAVEFCKKRFNNATLPTIHSEEENEFLKNNIDLGKSPIWINAKHNHQYKQTYWLDKSPVNFTHWDTDQPSDKVSLVCIYSEDGFYLRKTEPIDGHTQCVTLWSDGKWGTQVGCQVLLPVVCEKRLNTIIGVTSAPINIVPGGADDTTAYMGTSDPQLSSVSGSTGIIVGKFNIFTDCLLAIVTVTLLMQSRRIEQ